MVDVEALRRQVVKDHSPFAHQLVEFLADSEFGVQPEPQAIVQRPLA